MGQRLTAWLVKHRRAAAVNHQIVAGDESTGIAGEVQCALGDIHSEARLLQWYGFSQVGSELGHFGFVFGIGERVGSGRATIKYRGGDGARRNGVDANI